MIKTFRGLMANGDQDTIVLHTNDGSTGYRIKAFRLFPPTGDSNIEATAKIYKVSQTTIDNAVDFSDSTLLGAAMFTDTNSANYPVEFHVVFDREIFNQDIYITHSDPVMTSKVNYYIELEQVKLDLMENTVATLKDIRNLEAGIP